MSTTRRQTSGISDMDSGVIGKADDAVAKELLSMVSNGNRSQKISAIRALGYHQRYTEPIVTALLPLVAAPDDWALAEAAVSAIDKLSFSQPVPANMIAEQMIQVATNSEAPASIRRRAGGSVMAKLIPRDPAIAESLVKAMNQRDVPDDVQFAIIQGLGHAMHPSAAVIAYVRTAARRSSEQVRLEANKIFEKWGVTPVEP